MHSGLSRYPLVTQAMARERVRENARAIAEGSDPRLDTLRSLTFLASATPVPKLALLALDTPFRFVVTFSAENKYNYNLRPRTAHSPLEVPEGNIALLAREMG